MTTLHPVSPRSIRSTVLLLLLLILATLGTPLVHAEGDLALSTGVAVGYIDGSAHANTGGPRATLDVDTVLSPFLRVGYGLTPALSLEITGSLDLYSGTLTHRTGEGTSSLRGYSLSAGPTWYGGERARAFMGRWRPFLHAGVRYQGLRNDLDYPVTAFDDTWGVDLAVGIRQGAWDLRLCGTFATHDNDQTRPGFDAASSSDDLDLSRISLELAWCFAEIPQP